MNHVDLKIVRAVFTLAGFLLAGCSNINLGHSSESHPNSSLCKPTYSNPIIWEDLPDPEVIRVGDVYYYTASTFHHSPGAPLLRSFDLVNWEYLSHSVPELDFDPAYDLTGGSAYVKGIWASTLQYRLSDKQFYWMGCMHDLGGGYVFTAAKAEGPWTKHQSQECYYDMGLLIDPAPNSSSDKMYVAFGHDTISVAELSADGLTEVRRQVVLQTPADLSGPLEGARFYHIDGSYYIWLTQYANGEYVARSTQGPFGPYELRPLAVKTPYAGVASGSAPHQGGIVQTQAGDWYYMAFNDAFPAGRLPVMAPLQWIDGWPEVQLVDGHWGAEYPFPNVPCGADKIKPRQHIDTFSENILGPEWEWNHNPDNSRWQTGDGLVLQTATVTDDIYQARNTLTRRIIGPSSIATIELDFTQMLPGDIAGIAAFRDLTAWIAIRMTESGPRVVMAEGMALNNKNWQTSSTGHEVIGVPVSGNRIWLRIDADVRTTAGGGTAKFYYSTDAVNFKSLGNRFVMKRQWNYFLGYRFGLFNFARTSLGGSVVINSFKIVQP